ncbi:MAG: glycine--tRNA ligase subunit beta [Oceanicaulis sp.]
MAQFLLEFFSEEIPARMQARAEADLERLMTAALNEAGLAWESLQTFSGPRRLGLVMEGVPEKTADVREERKGPRTDAPEKAIEGFLRGAGLSSVDQCKVEEGKKGAFYVAVIEKPGRSSAEVLAEAIEATVKAFPWPKSMKFGEGARAQRWVRPLQRVVALLGGEVIPAEVFGVTASNVTEGHRIHGSGPFEVSGWDDYCAKLKENGVILMRSERKAKILLDARKVCADEGLTLVEDEGLLEEVTGLVEHPCAILGDMEPGFLDLPPEVIQLTMKTHQKYFAVQDKDGKLAPKFVVIANQDAPDGGAAIAAGNARVLSARLSDARHFWDLDRKKGLEAMAGELGKVTFHEKLGTVADKVERVAALARELAPSVGADPELAYTAAKLAKADLVSQMVYEFPELQGVMGRYYALEAGAAHPTPALPSRGGRDAESAVASPSDASGFEPDQGSPSEPNSAPSPLGEGWGGGLAGLSDKDRQAVADAIRDHYKPQGPSDAVPTAPVSAAVALADKLDTLVGFWAIDEKPTGSKDPFALRRAALGVIRVLEETYVELPLRRQFMNGTTALLTRWIGDYNDGYLKTGASFDVSEDPPNPDCTEVPIRSWVNWDGILDGERGEFVADARLGFPDVFDENDWTEEHAQGKRDLAELTSRLEILDQAVMHTVFDNLDDPSETRLQAARKVLTCNAPRVTEYTQSLLAFFADRLKVHLKDEGVRHDVIDAVFALGDDDLVRVTKKSRALQRFIETEDGAALLAGYRRAANILSAEEKKGFDLSEALSEVLGEHPTLALPSRGGRDAESAEKSPLNVAADEAGQNKRGGSHSTPSPSGEGRGGALTEDQAAALLIEIAKTAEAGEERALIAEIQAAEEVAGAALGKEDFEAAMAALARLRAPVDAFFDAVVVNAEDRMVRRNRLLLLSRIRAAADAVADFSRLEG